MMPGMVPTGDITAVTSSMMALHISPPSVTLSVNIPAVTLVMQVSIAPHSGPDTQLPPTELRAHTVLSSTRTARAAAEDALHPPATLASVPASRPTTANRASGRSSRRATPNSFDPRSSPSSGPHREPKGFSIADNEYITQQIMAKTKGYNPPWVDAIKKDKKG
ncbi:MAG TPA: hypothetical protein VN457_06460, partial [Chlamydiales bacterium]|nr:hypothetical protein [Chlamydiales bacterium]